MEDVEIGIRKDGSLAPGIYQYGTLPTLHWTDEDRIRVERWMADVASIHISNVQTVTVTEVGDRLVAEMEVIHRSAAGRHHIVGHCQDQPTRLDIRSTHDLYMADMVEVSCSGCGKVLGQISRSVPREDYARVLEDKHVDACMNIVRFEYPK